MVRINASFKDTIERIQCLQKSIDTKEVDKRLTACEYDLEGVSISFVRDMLNNNPDENCKFVSYGNNDNDDSYCSLIVQRHLTDEEKQKEIEHYQDVIICGKHQLLKWMEKPEHKEQILTYLDHYDIKIKGIN